MQILQPHGAWKFLGTWLWNLTAISGASESRALWEVCNPFLSMPKMRIRNLMIPSPYSMCNSAVCSGLFGQITITFYWMTNLVFRFYAWRIYQCMHLPNLVYSNLGSYTCFKTVSMRQRHIPSFIVIFFCIISRYQPVNWWFDFQVVTSFAELGRHDLHPSPGHWRRFTNVIGFGIGARLALNSDTKFLLIISAVLVYFVQK